MVWRRNAWRVGGNTWGYAAANWAKIRVTDCQDGDLLPIHNKKTLLPVK